MLLSLQLIFSKGLFTHDGMSAVQNPSVRVVRVLVFTVHTIRNGTNGWTTGVRLCTRQWINVRKV